MFRLLFAVATHLCDKALHVFVVDLPVRLESVAPLHVEPSLFCEFVHARFVPDREAEVLLLRDLRLACHFWRRRHGRWRVVKRRVERVCDVLRVVRLHVVGRLQDESLRLARFLGSSRHQGGVARQLELVSLTSDCLRSLPVC